MGRLFSSLVLRHKNSKSGQVETGKQCFPLTEYDQCKCKVQGINQPCLQILPYRRNTASDFDILVARCLFREPERLFYSAGDKVEGRPALHNHRLPFVVRQDECFRMVRRVVAPPSLP